MSYITNEDEHQPMTLFVYSPCSLGYECAKIILQPDEKFFANDDEIIMKINNDKNPLNKDFVGIKNGVLYAVGQEIYKLGMFREKPKQMTFATTMFKYTK